MDSWHDNGNQPEFDEEEDMDIHDEYQLAHVLSQLEEANRHALRADCHYCATETIESQLCMSRLLTDMSTLFSDMRDLDDIASVMDMIDGKSLYVPLAVGEKFHYSLHNDMQNVYLAKVISSTLTHIEAQHIGEDKARGRIQLYISDVYFEEWTPPRKKQRNAPV